MVYPPAFFMGALRHMVPRGNALFLMAQAHGKPLAAHLNFVSRNRLTYYHGVSTRDRRLTPARPRSSGTPCASPASADYSTWAASARPRTVTTHSSA